MRRLGRRAVVLVLKDKAEIVARNGAELHSERRVIPVPSVIRLVHFVRVPFRNRVPLSRRAVFARDGHRCQYCSRAAENIDHVVPRSRGGEHAWENVVASCRSCNARKEDRTLAEAGLRLRRAPARTPRQPLDRRHRRVARPDVGALPPRPRGRPRLTRARCPRLRPVGRRVGERRGPSPHLTRTGRAPRPRPAPPRTPLSPGGSGRAPRPGVGWTKWGPCG